MDIVLFEILKGYKHRRAFIFLKKTRVALILLDFLVVEGFILRYFLIGDNKIKIMLKYTAYDKPVLNNVKIFSNSKRSKYIGLYLMKAFVFRNSTSVFIFNTSKGFLNSKDALRLNVGGELVCQIN